MLRTPRRRGLAIGGVLLLFVTILALAFGSGPRGLQTASVPPFLDASNPEVIAAAGALTKDQFWRRLVTNLQRRDVHRSELWSTQSQFDNEAGVTAWQNGRRLEFLSFPAWRVPIDPSWSEDPFRSMSWLRTYHSLSWLRAPARAFLETGDIRYAEEVRHYVLDWIADNPRKHPAAHRAWSDHATAYRTDVLVELFDPVLVAGAEPAEIETLISALQLHGEVLSGYLEDERFKGTNHSLYHAMSLYSLASAFPVLRDAASWKRAARATISRLLTDLVEPSEGISTEQATGYHYLATALFVRVNEYLEQFGEAFKEEDLATLQRMVEFGALIAQPDGTVPAVGDTKFGFKAPLDRLRAYQAQGLSTPIADWILSDGRQGTAPPPLTVYPISGYALMRETNGAADEARLLFDFGAYDEPHGHVDALSFTLADGAGPILVDSGGPFAYGEPGRQGFVAAQAHNVVVVDGRSPPNGAPRLVTVVDSDELSAVEARAEIGGAVTQRRTLMWVRDAGVIIVVDRLSAADGQRHRFDLLYHTAPKTRLELMDQRVSLDRVSGPSIRIRLLSSDSATMDVVTGGRHPAIGWVTTGSRKKISAPVLRSRMHGTNGWFTTGIGLGGVDPRLQVQETSTGGLAIALRTYVGGWTIQVPAEGAPTITRAD